MKRTDVKGLVEYLDQTGNKLSKSFIYRLVREDRIPHKKIGSKIIFDIDHIEKWLSPEKGEAN
ncbi:helix-turn-helix domain-containing protein [Terrihalobacillus insolitus]|uniref:helix-turn-helix domain-containing protein n=1 Tax=Terrihalobacillus insolitus TaxID=2950438 RepID=UPI002341DDB3|nr:helix-turn-helix domain-containing protein [Terrihalobacillus insolitus]MDC3412562.1 helix-turn-helix domain-containing protein [Terrihalobacillus insolitus]